MADVRLTATNPENSQAVPVACNSKGELLLEAPQGVDGDAVQLDDDGTKQVIQSAGLGISDGSQENITLSANGDVQLAGNLAANGQVSALDEFVSSPATSTDTFFRGITDGVTMAEIKADGNAQFRGPVQAQSISTSLFAATRAGANGYTPVFAVRYDATAPDNGTNAFFVYSNGTFATVADQSQRTKTETTRDGYLADLNKLRVVKYNRISQDDGDIRELGLDAQEVQEIFPKLVAPMGEADGKPIYGIKASVIPYILIKALQEADDKIDALIERAEQQDAAIAELKAANAT